MKQLTIVAKDRVGLLADISEVLAQKSLNLDSISVETAGRTAIIHLSTSNLSEARKTLKENGFRVVDESGVLLKLKDRPGELAKVSRQLADKNINIRNVYILDAEGGEKVLAMSTDDNAAARKLLREYVA